MIDKTNHGALIPSAFCGPSVDCRGVSRNEGSRFTNEEFRALMALMMVEDSITVLIEEKAILVVTMNREAKARGYSDWIAAYHADWSTGNRGAGLAQPTAPKAITDVEFEAHVRAQGFKPSLEQLGFMRAGFELPGRPAHALASVEQKLTAECDEHERTMEKWRQCDAELSGANRVLSEVRVAVAQLRKLRLGEMSAKEEQLLDVIWERVKP